MEIAIGIYVKDSKVSLSNSSSIVVVNLVYFFDLIWYELEHIFRGRAMYSGLDNCLILNYKKKLSYHVKSEFSIQLIFLLFFLSIPLTSLYQFVSSLQIVIDQYIFFFLSDSSSHLSSEYFVKESNKQRKNSQTDTRKENKIQ